MMTRRVCKLACGCLAGLSFLFLAPVGNADLVGWWRLNDGSGDTAADSGPLGTTGQIAQHDAGGLGPNGSVWVNDPERGTVISFNGAASGAYVRVGNIPQMTLDQDFTWAFWGNQDSGNTTPNDIIFGNRRDENRNDFSPRQFIKFTPTKFEFHMNGNGNDNLDYEDIPSGVWIHHAIVKNGTSLTYYRDAVEAGTGAVTQPLDVPQPLFLGGDNTNRGGENWRGMLSDVQIYDNALTAIEIVGVFQGIDINFVRGDVNGDELVNLDDFEIILANFFQTVTTREEGDLNLDGTVDLVDFHEWKDHSAVGVPASASVPEPAGLIIAMLMGVGLFATLRGRCRA